ncbi:TPA: hypothetical protein ENG04_05720 [Candidatus Poribacteria bacterium]|nr:hypothetical protein [Candidatus Poribacteria bacterium]HEX29562.1 hypothetical protein [Candidatus Poribacteria bacterium]
MNLILIFIICLSAALTGVVQPSIGAKGGSIRGTVLDASTKKPIPGARISYLGPDRIEGEIRSDQDGNFRIIGLLPGAYTLRVRCEGYVPRKDLRVFVSERGESLLNIYLHRKVKRSEDWSRILETRPKLQGIWIGFNPYNKPIPFKLKITSGSLELNGSEVSLNELKAEIADWAKQHEDVEIGITIDRNMTWGEVVPILTALRGVINFIPDLPKTGEARERKLIGSIVDPNDKPVPGVRIEAYDEKVLLPTEMKKPVRVVTSDEGGRFELDGLSEGVYRLFFIKRGFMKWETLIPVRPTMLREIRRKFLMIRVGDDLPEFRLSPPFPLELPVTDHAGQLPIFVEPVIYINAKDEIAVDGRIMGKPDISKLCEEMSDKVSMSWPIVAADRRAKWNSISTVLTEETIRGTMNVFLVVVEGRR